MESQAKLFLKRIGKNIAKEEPAISNKGIQSYFHSFIQELPNGDVRDALINHKLEYITFLSRCVKTAARRQLAKGHEQNGADPNKKASVATQAAPRPSSKDENQLDLERSHSPYAAHQQIIRLLQSDKDVEELERLVEDLWVEDGASVSMSGNGGSDTNKYCLFLMMTDGSANLCTLKNIMALYFNSLQDDLEEITAKKSKKRAGKSIGPLVHFLKMCHLRRTLFGKDAGTFPSYADLVTAMLSIYLDLFIVAHRDEEVTGKVQRQMCSFVKQLTTDFGEKSLDTVLQMSAANSSNSACFCPLVRYLLREKPAKTSHSHYLHYVLTVCMWRSILSDFDDLVMETRLIRAPKGFLQWVIEWQPQLNGEFPDDRKFKGRTVTTFLLDDADDDMLALLKDAIANAERKPADDQDAADETGQDNIGEARPSKKKAKKRKKQKAEAAATNDDEAVGDGEAAAFSNDVGDEEATFMMESNRKRKLTDDVEVFDLSNLARPGTSDQSGSMNAGSLFVIDRGESSTPRMNGSGLTQEPKKKKRKKISDSNKTSVEEISESALEVNDSTDGSSFFVDRGAGKNAAMRVEESAGVDSRQGKKGKEEACGVDSDEGDLEAAGAGSADMDETVVIGTSGSGEEGPHTLQADLTVPYSIDRGDKKAKQMGSSPAASGETLVRTRLRTASEKLLSGQEPSSGDRRQQSKKSQSSASSQGILDVHQHRRRAASERLTTDHILVGQNRRRSASERPMSDQESSGKQKSRVTDSTPRNKSLAQRAASELSGINSLELETVSERDSFDNQSANKSTAVKTRTSVTASGIRSKASKKADLENACESSSYVSPFIEQNMTLNSEASSAKSQNSSRVSEAVPLDTEMVPDSDVGDADEDTCPSSSSIAPNSFSGTDSQSEVPLVPDLSVHLKRKPTLPNTKRRRSSVSADKSTEASPTLKEREKSAAPGLAGFESPAGLAARPEASASAERKDSKRKRKQSSLSPVEQAGTEEEAWKLELEKPQKSSEKSKKTMSSRPPSQETEVGEGITHTTVSSKTPPGIAKSQPTKPKSTTPVSRRTRSRRSTMGTTPVSSSVTATDTKSESPSRTAAGVKTQPNLSASKSRRTSLLSGKSTSRLSTLQKKATRRSVGFDLKTSETSHSRRKSPKDQSETKTGFTSLKERPQSRSPPSPSKVSRQEKVGSEDSPTKSAEAQRERNSSGSSPSKRSPSSVQTSPGHGIGTRSRTPSKGYNLRKSGRFQ